MAPTLEALAAVLQSDCQDVLVPLLHPGDVGDAGALQGALQTLSKALPTVAVGSGALQSPGAVLEAVRAAGLPVVPTARLVGGDADAMAAELAAWAGEVDEVDDKYTRMVLLRDRACDGVGALVLRWCVHGGCCCPAPGTRVVFPHQDQVCC